MHALTPTHRVIHSVLESSSPKSTMSVNECQSWSAPTSPNVDNVNPAMSDNQTTRAYSLNTDALEFRPLTLRAISCLAISALHTHHHLCRINRLVHAFVRRDLEGPRDRLDPGKHMRD